MGKKRAYFSDARHRQKRIRGRNNCKNLHAKPQDVLDAELRSWWDLDPEERYRLKRKRKKKAKKKNTIDKWWGEVKTTQQSPIFISNTQSWDFAMQPSRVPIATIEMAGMGGPGTQMAVTLPRYASENETWVLRGRIETPTGTELIFENVEVAPLPDEPEVDPWESRISKIMDE